MLRHIGCWNSSQDLVSGFCYMVVVGIDTRLPGSQRSVECMRVTLHVCGTQIVFVVIPHTGCVGRLVHEFSRCEIRVLWQRGWYGSSGSSICASDSILHEAAR